MRFLLMGDKQTAKAHTLFTCAECPMLILTTRLWCAEQKKRLPVGFPVQDAIWKSCRLPKEPR